MCFNLKKRKKMDNQKINEIVTKELRGRISRINQVFMPDESYRPISKDGVKKILGETLIDRRSYTGSVGDCDDFAHLLKGEFIKKAWNENGRYPFAFGILWGQVKMQDKWVGHAINWFIDNKEKLHLVEPQTDEIFKPDKDKLKEVFFLLM